MSESSTKFPGFFSRRRHHSRNGSSPGVDTELVIPKIETTRTSSDRANEPGSSRPSSDNVHTRPGETSTQRHFFRIPRRKKMSLSSKEPFASGPSALDSVGVDPTRLSSQTTRSPFEALLRPTLSACSSSTSVSQTFAGSVMLAASSSLAAPGSPLMEIENPVESQSLVKASRPGSTTSAHSFRTTYSTPISEHSGGQTVETATKIGNRGRSLTYAGRESQQKVPSVGRSGKFFSMSRLRRENDENLLFRPISRERSPAPPASPQKTMETFKPTVPTLPVRIASESAHQYLARMTARMHKTVTASVLATSEDEFHLECLQLYMQQFNFVEDPLDIALRKFLMDTHLPKETQQIDRVLSAFSERYQVCNPRLYNSHTTPYVLSFALIMLHTDRFNQNNKNKMTKGQFIKNTVSEHTEHVSQDVLEYFYDNIISTPFILVEDDVDSPTIERSNPAAASEDDFSTSRNASVTTLSLTQATGTFGRRSMDLYPLIMEDKLSTLRPQLSPLLEQTNIFSYTGTLPVVNVARLHSAFTHPATLQLVSARSRPEAFVNADSAQNPFDTDPGLVDIKITKIGILKKKEQKKAGSKPTYREWGVMLTPSQLLLFKNVAWVKLYMTQARDRPKDSTEEYILKPPVQDYAPDTYMPTSDTVAMYDSTTSKKGNHFCFFGRGGEQTHLMAASEEDMNDWIGKINYAAAFHTIGVRIRGMNPMDKSTTHSPNARRVHRHASSSTLSTYSGSVASLTDITVARQNVLRSKIGDMDAQIRLKEEKLSVLMQQGRNLCTLAPIQQRTRSAVISAAGSLSAKLSWARMELVKTQCHRDILSKDLELELNPNASVFTAPSRPKTPPLSVASPKSSPSKSKLGTVGNLMRQVSTDTMRKVNKSFSNTDLAKESQDTSSLSQSDTKIADTGMPDFDTNVLKQIDFATDSLDGIFTTSSFSKSTSTERAQSPTPSSVEDKSRPRTAPNLKLNLPFAKRNGKNSSKLRKDAEIDSTSILSSPSSERSSSHFILHGRKVSVVQTPANLLTSNLETSEAVKRSSTPTVVSVGSQKTQDSSGDVFLDALE